MRGGLQGGWPVILSKKSARSAKVPELQPLPPFNPAELGEAQPWRLAIVVILDQHPLLFSWCRNRTQLVRKVGAGSESIERVVAGHFQRIDSLSIVRRCEDKIAVLQRRVQHHLLRGHSHSRR